MTDKRNPEDAKLWAIIDDPAANSNERQTAFTMVMEREAKRGGKDKASSESSPAWRIHRSQSEDHRFNVFLYVRCQLFPFFKVGTRYRFSVDPSGLAHCIDSDPCDLDYEKINPEMAGVSLSPYKLKNADIDRPENGSDIWCCEGALNDKAWQEHCQLAGIDPSTKQPVCIADSVRSCPSCGKLSCFDAEEPWQCPWCREATWKPGDPITPVEEFDAFAENLSLEAPDVIRLPKSG